MQINHSEFGLVDIVVNTRAKKFIFRFNDDGRLLMTVPAYTSEKEWTVAIDKLSPKLHVLKNKRKVIKLIDESFVIDTPDFKMSLREGLVQIVHARMSQGILDVVYPKETDFKNEELQKWLVNITEEAVRYQAKKVLPQRLMSLAEKYHLSVSSVSIRKSHGRWGSCSSKKSINLSLYLILLPRHLQDYVILHELTHTIYMNHSEMFWKQLNLYCGNDSKILRKEMAKYNTSIFFKAL